MKRIRVLLSFAAVAAVAGGLAACSAKEQGASTQAQAAVPAYTGTAVPAYTDPGWKPGDQASWEARIAARTRAGQDEYQRATGP